MFVTDLRDGMIIEANYERIGRQNCYYVVMHVNGNKVGVCFKGNVNEDNYPAGWLDLEDDGCECDLSDLGYSAVYEPNYVGCTFSGDFNNPDHYQVVWKENN